MIPYIFAPPKERFPFMERSDHRIILLLLITLGSCAVLAQPRPDAQCTWLDQSTVTISWVVDNTNFGRYYIEKSYDNQNFVLIEMVADNSITSYSYIEPLLSADIYYRLFTEDYAGVGKSAYSDTIRLSHLIADPDPNNSIAHLTWNPVSGNSAADYKVFRQAGTAQWQFLTSTKALEYYDTITSPFCTETLMRYKVESHDPTIPCISTTSYDSLTLSDGVYPGWLADDIVKMDTVSIDFNGNVSISWEPYPASDIEFYVIYRRDGTLWPPIDTVPADQFYFTDSLSSATLQSVAYRVAAKDTCHAPGPGGFANPFSTIFLKPISWDYCDTAVLLQWDSTLWMEPYPDLFTIYEIDTGTFANHPIGETPQTEFTYVSGFKPDSTYCFFVRANNTEGKSSSSCIQCFQVNRPEQPDTMHLQLATVDTNYNDRITIAVSVDTVPSETKCLILRRENMTQTWDTLQSLPVNDQDFLSFTDTTAQVGQTAYYYRTIILDGCDNPSWLPVNEVRTIYLTGSASDQVNHLHWNRYESTVSRVTEYRLYRKINGLLDTVFAVGQDTVFDDIFFGTTEATGRFSYLVEARILPFYDELLDTLSSYSNEIMVIQVSRINMPNAFTPNSDGTNDFFAPRNIFSEDHAEYLFIIYNRWGEKIYKAISINDRGWDGTFNNEPSPTGVYVYFIRYVTLEGEIFESKGSFTLLR